MNELELTHIKQALFLQLMAGADVSYSTIPKLTRIIPVQAP